MILLAALLQGGAVAALDAELRASTSATATLQARCAVPIRAQVDRAAHKTADAAVRAQLEAGPGVTLVYRLVRLTCGDTVYSRAENWYRPDRLTEAMNAALRTGETPFGVAIRPLAPTRRTLDTQFPGAPDAVLRHRAVVMASDGRALAYVVETYTDAVPQAPRADK